MPHNGNGAVPSPPPRKPRKPGPRRAYNRKSALTQALDARDIAADCMVKLPTLTGEALEQEALRVRALRDAGTLWDTACDRARVLQRKGLPKSVPADNDPTAKAQRQSRTLPKPTPSQ